MKVSCCRLTAICLVVVLTISLFPCSVFAATQASDYINRYSVGLTQGSSSGQLLLVYNIVGTGVVDTIGISKILVFKSDGVKYKTIYGSTANGLLQNNTFSNFGAHSISVATGDTYYCQVTFYSSKNGGYDTRTVYTSNVVAP